MPLNRPAHRARLTRALLGCGLAAGPAFVGIASVEGWRRAEYRALRHPVSSLALGERGAVQSANFLMTGVLCSAFAVGVARAGGPGASRLDPVLVALPAAGLLACGLFPADPVNGYPPGTPPTPERMTRPGYLHLAASSAIMAGVPVATALHARRASRSDHRRWAEVSAAATGVTAASFAAACAGFAQVPPLPRVAGLLQRVAVSTGFAWLGMLAVRTLRSVDR